MSDAPNPPTQAEQPAEGSREVVEEAEKGTTEEHPERQTGG